MSLILTADKNPGTASWSTTSFSSGISAAGTAVIAGGIDTSVVVNIGLGHEGDLVLATFAEAPVEAKYVWAPVVSAAGDVTLNINTSNTGGFDLSITYAVLSPL